MNQKIQLLKKRKNELQTLLNTPEQSLSPSTKLSITEKIDKLSQLIELTNNLNKQEDTLKIQYLTLIKERNVYFDKLRRIEVVGEENEWRGPCLRKIYNHLIDLR